ncbi:MAG: tetratricopeptide repeat protein [Bacteroidota bacterium]|nr:tetratricopeptide repeat protein [Bacteroidota bacterium]
MIKTKLRYKNYLSIVFIFLALILPINQIYSDSIQTNNEKANKSFDLSPHIKRAYLLIWQGEPVNPYAENSDTYINGLSYWIGDLRNFIDYLGTNSDASYHAYVKSANECLENLSSMPRNSPWYYYCRSEVYTRLAIARVQKGNNAKGLLAIREALLLINTMNEKFPDFVPGKKYQYGLTLVGGVLPNQYKGLASFFGIKGNLKESVKNIKAYYQTLSDPKHEYNFMAAETGFIYALVNLFITEDFEQVRYALDHLPKYTTGECYEVLRTTIYLKLHQSDKVAKILKKICTPTNKPVYPILDYYYGQSLLYECNPKSKFYIARFIKSFQGDNYIKDAWLKLSWAFQVGGETRSALNARRLVKTEGTEFIEEDKSAAVEASFPLDNLHLLQGRLYFDGGLYNLSVLELNQTKLSDNQEDAAQLYYRYGRSYQALKQNTQAIENYNKAIKISLKNSYYAPASTYFIGSIYEGNGNKAEAKKYFNRTLKEYKNYPYFNSFELKAKAGLTRLK